MDKVFGKKNKVIQYMENGLEVFFKRKTVYIIIAIIKLKLIPVIPLMSTVVLLVNIFLERMKKEG